MKHPGPIRREPAQPSGMRRWLTFALTLLTIGLSAGVYFLYYEKFIGDGLLPSMICFILAAAIGAFAASDIGKQASTRRYKDCDEIDPPPELYSVWPMTFRSTAGSSRLDADDRGKHEG